MSDYEQFPPVEKTFSAGPGARGRAQQSCVSTSTAEHEAEQQRMIQRMQDGQFSALGRLKRMERVLLHLGDWYTEYKVPIRETTFWKNEVFPLLTP